MKWFCRCLTELEIISRLDATRWCPMCRVFVNMVRSNEDLVANGYLPFQ